MPNDVTPPNLVHDGEELPESVIELLRQAADTGDPFIDGPRQAETLIEAFKRMGRTASLTESSFWCCLVFESLDQKNEFLRLMGWDDLNPDYLDGLIVAERLKVDLPPSGLKFKERKPDPDWVALAG